MPSFELNLKTFQENDLACLTIKDQLFTFKGKWINDDPWGRFGLYNKYVVVRDDGQIKVISTHAGELVPGSTEDLVDAILNYDLKNQKIRTPLTLELDPTNVCFSKNCGGHCFSASYRALNPRGHIPYSTLEEIIRDFSAKGGRILRFDGGGDPLAHPDVRSGKLPELGSELGLKSTILSALDAIQTSDLRRIARAGTYLRVSLNAAEDATRQLFHGNSMKVSLIFKEIERLANWIHNHIGKLPIGSTYLIGKQNVKEIFACAIKAKNSGFSHFSVRRVLGPPEMRPHFTEKEEREIYQQLKKVQELSDYEFRVFIPWRSINEEDLNPSIGDFEATQCWQSTFKTIIEQGDSDHFKVQLCGRYRGSGYGQKMQLPSVISRNSGKNWVDAWQKSFKEYPISRQDLINTCVSCIDRGFIKMMDELINFLNPPIHSFKILHLSQL